MLYSIKRSIDRSWTLHRILGPNYFTYFTVTELTMDPLTALGLAWNIIQIIDFASKLAATVHEINNSATGATAENETLESLSRETKYSTERLAQSLTLSLLTKDEKAALLECTTRCGDVSNEVLGTLVKMKASNPRSIRQTFRAAANVFWYSGQKKNLINKLEKCQNSLQRLLIQVLR
jgi:hypothetical protein